MRKSEVWGARGSWFLVGQHTPSLRYQGNLRPPHLEFRVIFHREEACAGPLAWNADVTSVFLEGDFVDEALELNRLPAVHRLFDTEVRPGEVEATERLGVEGKAIDVEDADHVRVEAARDAELLEDDGAPIDSRRNAPAIGAQLVHDLAGYRFASVQVHPDQEWIQPAAQVVQVRDQNIAPAFVDEPLQEAARAECVREIPMPGRMHARSTIVFAKKLPFGRHADGEPLRERGYVVPVSSIAQGRFDASAGGMAGHEPKRRHRAVLLGQVTLLGQAQVQERALRESFN